LTKYNRADIVLSSEAQNKKLKELVKVIITFNIPKQDNDKNKFDDSKLQGYIKQVAKVTGGTTTYQAKGQYIMDDGQMQSDNNYMVKTSTDSRQDLQEVKRIIAGMAKDLNQESIYFEVQQADVEFITADMNQAV
jgi:hypothetical protein